MVPHGNRITVELITGRSRVAQNKAVWNVVPVMRFFIWFPACEYSLNVFRISIFKEFDVLNFINTFPYILVAHRSLFMITILSTSLFFTPRLHFPKHISLYRKVSFSFLPLTEIYVCLIFENIFKQKLTNVKRPQCFEGYTENSTAWTADISWRVVL
jgi:hypothetical protein